MTMIHNIPRGSMGHRDKTAKLAYFSIYIFSVFSVDTKPMSTKPPFNSTRCYFVKRIRMDLKCIISDRIRTLKQKDIPEMNQTV